MSVVLSLLSVCLAIILFESARVLANLPSTSGWLVATAKSSTCVVVILAFIMVGLMFAAQSAVDFDPQSFGLIEASGIVAILLATAFALRKLYARRNETLAASNPAAVVSFAESMRNAPHDDPGLGGAPGPGANIGRKSAA